MAAASTQKFTLFALTAMVVASMVGAGIFSLPRTFGIATGPFGSIIAWIITGGGMFMLARIFQTLVEKRPDIGPGALLQLWSCLGNPTTGESTDAQ